MKIKFELDLSLAEEEIVDYICDSLLDEGITLEPKEIWTPPLSTEEAIMLRIGDDVSYEIPLRDKDGNPGGVYVYSTVMGRVFDRPAGSGEATLTIYLLPTCTHGTGALEDTVPANWVRSPKMTDRLYYISPLDDRGHPHQEARFILETDQIIVPGESLLIPSGKMEELFDDILRIEGLEKEYSRLLAKVPADDKYKVYVSRVTHDVSFRGSYVYVK